MCNKCGDTETTIKKNNMKLLLGSSWKTSLAGLIGAIALLVVDYIKPGDMDLKTIVESIVVFIVGKLAADAGSK